jgi:RNA polymerase sigma-70 factor (ECF subfamily)
VWVGVFRNIGTFSGTEAQFRSWVFVVAHRRVQDERRRLGRRPEPSPIDGEDQIEPAGAWADPADDEAVSRVAADQLRVTCRRLAPDQRDVVLLRTLADLTVEQTATVLGKSEGAVKALQRRGFSRLRQLLAEGGVPL